MLLVPVQTALQHMHMLLPGNTAANNFQTGHPLAQDHCAVSMLLAGRVRDWLASRVASQLTTVPVQTFLQHVHVLLPAKTAVHSLQAGHPPAQDHHSWQGPWHIERKGQSGTTAYYSNIHSGTDGESFQRITQSSGVYKQQWESINQEMW